MRIDTHKLLANVSFFLNFNKKRTNLFRVLIYFSHGKEIRNKGVHVSLLREIILLRESIIVTSKWLKIYKAMDHVLCPIVRA